MFALDQLRLSELPGFEAAADAPRLGAVGLALAAACGAWYERLRLRSILRARIGEHDSPAAERLRRAAAAAAACVPAGLAAVAFSALHPTLRAAGVFVLFLAGYLAAGLALRLPGIPALFQRFRRRE
jgi:hypothetical protein